MVIDILLELVAIKSIYDLDSLHNLSNLNFASHPSLTKIHFLPLFVLLSQPEYDLRFTSLPLLSQSYLFTLLGLLSQFKFDLNL